MKTMEVEQLLHRYFEGETTAGEERELENYFNSDEVANELKEYAGLFRGISELADSVDDDTIEKDILTYINKNNPVQKPRKIWLWQAVSGIAASIILVVGGFLFFQQQEHQYADTFDDPEVAYAYAEQTLSYVSAKYNKGLAALTNFEKLQAAAEPLQHGIRPVNAYFEMIEKMNVTNNTN